MITRNRNYSVLGILLVLGAIATPAHAQVASPSTRALGMGENFTAAARGYSALAWNPAGLALTGNPGSSFTIATLRGVAGLAPLTVPELAEYSGEKVPANVRQSWLNDIVASGGEAGRTGAEVTPFALQIGRVAASISTTMTGNAKFSPGIAELILFGNADANGDPKAIDLSGSKLDLAAYTTAAFGYGHPFVLSAGDRLAIGVSAKYTVGHALARGMESTGSASADPLEVTLSFPMVHTFFGDDNEDYAPTNASGFGLDAGLGYETGRWTLAASVQNLFNTFSWDADKLRYRRGELLFNEEDQESDFDELPYAQAPAALRSEVEDLGFKPAIALGAQYRANYRLTLSADARIQSEDALQPGPAKHFGAGMEFRLFDALPLRVGAAYVSMGEGDAGFQFGGGVGLKLGGFDIAASALKRDTDLSSDSFFQITFLGRGQ